MHSSTGKGAVKIYHKFPFELYQGKAKAFTEDDVWHLFCLKIMCYDSPQSHNIRRIYIGNIAIFKFAIFWSYHLHLREKSQSFSFPKLRDFLVGSAHVRSLLFPLPGRTVDGRKRTLLCKEKTWFPHGSNACCCFLPSRSIIQHQ